jgi:hypothetical protein
MLENQNPELFQDVNKPKYSGTLNLDRWVTLLVLVFARSEGPGEPRLWCQWPSLASPVGGRGRRGSWA